MAQQRQLYNFKNITTIPGAKKLIDIVLSQTQRKTPTEVHKQFKISRIRNFYMRKVKYCQQVLRDRLQQILTELPKLDDIHPFYSDLFNVLYDRDHYKCALGQVNAIKGVVDRVAKEYVRMLKYGSSLYKCKMLKRAALGRMCTAVKKLDASLKYLEDVRQHMGRLPSINPHVRTIILTGYPNVGKSSFMNHVSHANVDVQPYSFTTKSLYVGHFDYNYIRWQIIDTPGLLDHPLEDMNTIEMTAITALAHIPAAIIYLIDISEECGFKIHEQVKLYHSIKALFHSKPIVIVLNKIDAMPVDSLMPEHKKLIEEMANNEPLVAYQECSTLSGEGVDDSKNKACKMLLDQRVCEKASSKKAEMLMNRLYVTNAQPRPHNIPESIIRAKMNMKLDSDMDGDDIDKSNGASFMTEKELEDKYGGPGVYSIDLRKNYILDDPNWKYDVFPEIYDGKNVFDFVDPDIDERLKMLEMEEQLLMREINDDPIDGEWKSMQNALDEMHSSIKAKQLERKLQKKRNGPAQISMAIKAKTAKKARKSLGASKLMKLSMIGKGEDDMNTLDVSDKLVANINQKSTDRISLLAKKSMGMSVQRDRKLKLIKKPKMPKGVRAENDRSINVKMPKHLFSGKRGIGKTNHR
ncbi:NOG1, nucleolar GTP-binding protein [Babesia microti strain RI]|uniref:Nucleolar GTP-binding protein 1 n=1 Tax=Babesia microti (strain RI) TaxID=1133968 RepID=I7JDP4_BABMR|nr:NOG1, nucleolar GTP-binding protein [Babesia microti strain RI]CCF75940.2 NOG1, nucleolar GTP-binding protein [Babesia microti strain RI]|eukprot:XP_012650348.2 NOG1, nucleolar GTP-binding protein [Babesia microti strain RI]